MQCVECDYAHSKVINSEPKNYGETVRRRRECIKCGARFTTEEHIKLKSSNKNNFNK